MNEEELPLITVGLITLNRAWIVGYMLDSLFSQSYPMEKINLIVVDGGSTDGTLDVIKNKVNNSNLYSHQIIITKPSIPEQRNLCIDSFLGSVLVFWDSDEIINEKGLEQLVKIILDRQADIATAIYQNIFLNSFDEISKSIEKFHNEMDNIQFDEIKIVPSIGMGHTAISRNVIESEIRFDPDLTWAEDWDFGLKARENGFNLVEVKNARAININNKSKNYSDIYSDMPLKLYLKALSKKARTRVLGSSFKITFNYLFFYYRQNKRFLFYLGYPLMIMISIYGFIINNLFYLMNFPIYISFYTILQVNMRGFKKGLKMTFRSIIAGIPYSYLQLYYFAREMMNARVYDNLDPHSDQNG